MEGMVTFLAGAVFGAIASVALDRLVRKFIDSRPTVKVSSSCSYGVDGQKFTLVVTNIGSMQLPPYEIVLRHPKSGSINWFPKTQESERLPGQMDRFSFTLGRHYGPEAQAEQRILLSTLTILPETRAQMSDEEFRQWRLQLILTNSDHIVLFEHAGAGSAVAEIVRGILLSGQVNPTGEQMLRIHANNSWIIKSKRGTTLAFRRMSDWWKRVTADPRVLTACSAARGWYPRAFGRRSPK